MPAGGGSVAAGRRARKKREDAARVASGADTLGPIADYYVKKTAYPANNQIWHAVTDAETGAFKPEYISNVAFGTTPAPKGHYVIRLFNKDRQSVSGIADLDAHGTVTTTSRPSCLCTFAGRIFYYGVADLGFQGKVWFSRVVRDYLDLGRCYQEQDPTAEDFNELVDTDGGEIPIPSATGVLGLVPMSRGVVVLGANGVWYINGGDVPFTATNYSVDKLHSSGVVSQGAFAEIDGSVVFCSEEGIYVLQNTAAGVQPQSITDTTIKTFYSTISGTAKKKLSLVYSRNDRKLYFLFGNEDASSAALRNALVYDLVLSMWTALTFDAEGYPAIVAAFDKKNFSNVTTTETVVVVGDTVVVAGDPVGISSTFPGRTGAGVKLITHVGGTNITFSEFNSRRFVDWYTYNGTGTNYPSYVEVGPVSAGELMRTKQLLYVTSYFEQTEDGWELVDGEYQLTNQSGCMLTAKWNWSSNSMSGRWTNPQQAYKLQTLSMLDAPDFDYGYSVIKSKLLVRGSGRAFSVRWDSEAGKDMQLLGWAAPIKVSSAEE